MTASENARPRNPEPGGEYRKAAVEEVPRAEGYNEFRCIPAHWLPRTASDMRPLVAEGLSTLMGLERDPDFWSASDAAMRAREIAPEALDQRELAILATRRSNDYNRPSPWASARAALNLEAEWGGQKDPHVHPFANLPNEESNGILGHYGMTATLYRSQNHEVVTGMGIREGRRARLTHEPWHGGIGSWVSWRTVNGWQAMPRRQDIPAEAMEGAAEGRLLLFVSHRWETAAHPDPTGRQIKAIRTGLTLALCSAISDVEPDKATGSGLPEIIRRFFESEPGLAVDRLSLADWAGAVIEAAKTLAEEEAFLATAEAETESWGVKPILDRVRGQILLWYDYASMYQAPRSMEQEHAFREELRLLNRIQAGAATLVLSDDEEYLGRAWCFLEVAGGIRNAIAEVTPSWSQSLRLYSSANRWMHISDQFIGALNIWGAESIRSIGLVTTDESDLAIVAELISQLPLGGLVESDGMDLIGGSIPMAYANGKGWVTGNEVFGSVENRHIRLEAFPDYGRIPPREALERAALEAAADGLTGECGMWIYATQRVLALTWLTRRNEIRNWLAAGGLALPHPNTACATWADSLCLAEDGKGWTRYVPSALKTLVVVVQADLPEICLLYESVVQSHLAAGATVITVSPEIGSVKVQVPKGGPIENVAKANALVVPRIRRSTANSSYLLLGSGVSRKAVERAALLRLEPAQEAAGIQAWSPEECASLGEDRVRLEAECRTTAACWEALLEHGVNPLSWPSPDEGRAQMAILRKVLVTLRAFTANPLLRRNLLYGILEHDTKRGNPLPMRLPQRVERIVAGLMAEGYGG